ncbi:MAG: protein disulfide oxidoreductase [Pseudomonadales bacterium]|nr:protein disulfide oxidoreductase [Pseudomonadales bacterium]
MLKKTLKKSSSWVILLAIFFGGQAWINRDMANGAAPPLQAQTLNGEIFHIDQFKGEPAIIYFWASWCGICRTMESSISELSQEKPFISVAMQSGSKQEVLDYLKKKTLKTPVINDPYGQLSASYGIKGVPAVFILDKDGNIRYSTSGYSPSWAIRIRLWLASL